MKPYHYFLLLLLFPLIQACEFDDTPPIPPNTVNTMDLVFKIRYGNEPVVAFQDSYTHDEGYEMIFTRFSFFMTNVTLINGDGETEVLEIFHVRSLKDQNGLEDAERGYVVTVDSIPDGSYDAIRFGIGLPPDLNGQEPADFTSDHPLAATGEYWVGWESYIFHKTEGNIDFDGDGTFDTGMALHVGADTTYRQKEMPMPLEFGNGNTNEVDITIDLKEFLMPTGKPAYDLQGTPQIHSLSQMEEALELSDNLVNAIN